MRINLGLDRELELLGFDLSLIGFSEAVAHEIPYRLHRHHGQSVMVTLACRVVFSFVPVRS